MSRLPYEEQKAKTFAEFYSMLEESMREMDSLLLRVGLARERIRGRLFKLQEECPEVVAQWRGPLVDMLNPEKPETREDGDDLPPAA